MWGLTYRAATRDLPSARLEGETCQLPKMGRAAGSRNLYLSARSSEEAHDGSGQDRADGHVLNGLTARDAFSLLVGCILTVLDEAPSNEEGQQLLDNCVNLLKTYWVGLKH
jgi:hypothetical protein